MSAEDDYWPDYEDFPTHEAVGAFYQALADLERHGEIDGLVNYLRHSAPLSKGVARALARILSGEPLDAWPTDGTLYPTLGPQYRVRVEKVPPKGGRPADPKKMERALKAAEALHDRVKQGNTTYSAAFNEVRHEFQLGDNELRRGVWDYENVWGESIPRSEGAVKRQRTVAARKAKREAGEG